MINETASWWGERWLAWLQALEAGPGSEGQVKSAQRVEGQVQIRPGKIEARVWVSDRRQVACALKLRPWVEKDWRRALDQIAARPELAQRVLSGTLGPELEEALGGIGLALFPDRASVGCACGNGTTRCRHINYMALQTAEMLSGNPFLWLEVLGRSRTDLLAQLKARLSDIANPAVAADKGQTAPEDGEPLDPARFWEGAVDPAAVPVRPGESTAPDGLIRSLGPLPVEERLYLLPAREEVRAGEMLRRMVVQVARTASAQAVGEAGPVFRPAPLPGKPVSLAARLAPEIEEAVRTEDGLLSLDDLAERCPTSAGAGQPEALRKALLEACAMLPPDLITVAGRYAGPAAALLREAAFRHVVTLDEWLTADGASDADWVRGLAAANQSRPSLAPWFERLKPEVGDELWIRPQEGSVAITLRRRAEREPSEMLHHDATASRLLQMLTGFSPTGRLTEQEAVASLLAEGAYRDGFHPDPIWLVPLLGPGLWYDPAEGAVTRVPNTWRPGFPRWVYGNWRLDQVLMGFQARMMKQRAFREEIERATACITFWSRLWRGDQTEPDAIQSLGPFLHFLWNVVPREAARHRILPEQVPAIMTAWFTFLEESYPAAAGAFTRHRLACSLLDHYAHRCHTAPPEGAGEGEILAWQAEGFRWIGPAHYRSGGGYR